MSKRAAYIILYFSIIIFLASCHNQDKVYDSTGKEKIKRYDFTVGKYNKLLKSGDMDAKYAAAIKYFEKESYTRALQLFEELMSVYRATAKAEEIHYYYAYCHYNLQDYILAGYHFRQFVKNYPLSKHAEECAYINAYCFYLTSPEYSLDQTDTKLAIKEFQKFAGQYPKSEKMPQCNEILDELRGKLERKAYETSKMYYNLSDYKASVVSFDNFIKDFPGSKHIEEISYLTIKSYYLLALNSIDAKKQERFKACADRYLKFIDSNPKSSYLKQAEIVYSSALQQLEKYNKQNLY